MPRHAKLILLAITAAGADARGVPAFVNPRAFAPRAALPARLQRSPRATMAKLDMDSEGVRIARLASSFGARPREGLRVAPTSSEVAESEELEFEAEAEAESTEEGSEAAASDEGDAEIEIGGESLDKLVAYEEAQEPALPLAERIPLFVQDNGLALFAGISVLAGGWIFARQQATKTLKVSAETAPETIQQYGKELHELGDDPEGKITLHKKTQQQLGFLVRQKEYKMFAAAMKALIRETVSIDMVRAAARGAPSAERARARARARIRAARGVDGARSADLSRR